jgi:hypothetical protein
LKSWERKTERSFQGKICKFYKRGGLERSGSSTLIKGWIGCGMGSRKISENLALRREL